MTKRFWRIRGERRFQTIFDQTLPLGSITDNQLKALLRCLAAKADLTNEEIVGLFARHRTKAAKEYMPVQPNGPMPGYYCGIDTVFIAIVVDEAGERVDFSGQGFHNPDQKT
jgi:hypothetical protein